MNGLLANRTLMRWLPVIVLPPILLFDGLMSKHGGKSVDAIGVLFTYLAVLPLVWREGLGFFALSPLLVGSVVLLLWRYEPATTVVAIPAWALFELAKAKGRRETVIAAVALAPCVIVAVLPFADDAGQMVSITLRNWALCELALAVGFLMWHREREADQRVGEERLRIAREVHDVVAHAMVAINVQAGVAAHLLDQDPGQAREALLHIKRTSGEALTDLRATLGVLRDPGQSAPVGPAAGLGDLETVADQLRAAGVEVTVDVDADGVPSPVHSASYRIVQEALTNVLRHARAQQASVVVRALEDRLTIVVADDGTGAGAPGGAGAGVRGMRERAAALGGTLDAGPAADGGWRVEAALPL